MKKYVQNFWVRVLACILCTITLTGAVLSGGLIAGVSLIGTQEEVNEDGKKAIAENYAAYIYDHLDDEKELEKFLTTTNFTCSVTKAGNSQEEDAAVEDKATVLYNSLADTTEWDYEFEILDSAYVYYDVESVWDALRISPVINEVQHSMEVPITGYAFDAETGLFYYCTDNGFYFLADYIMISQDGTAYDYNIKNVNNQKIYYNGYYDRTLDATQYEQWDWVQLNEVRMPISTQATGNEVAVITDSSIIQESLYSGVHYENEHLNSIVYYPEVKEESYIIQIKVDDLADKEQLSDDLFAEWMYVQDAFYANKGSYQAALASCVLLFILSFALLIYSANDNKEKLGFLQEVPVGIYTGAAFLLEVPLMVLMGDVVVDTLFGYPVFPFDVWLTFAIAGSFFIIFIAFIWLQNIITRIKTKTFIRYSEIYYGYKIFKWTWRNVTQPFRFMFQMMREHTSLFIKGLVLFVVIGFVEFMVIEICWYDRELYVIWFLLSKAVELPLVFYILLQMKKLQEGGKRIASGDLSEPIDTSKMIWEFKKHGENINKVSDGIALAVDERMKSERFKTELITNVSHDIKTPLTSIINYVDLIKKEEIADETLKEYVDVLDRQSARLKKLIEDLMEASKASTGNLAVNMEDCDIEVLLTQLIGEFEERLSGNQLEVVVQKPEHPVIVSADGRHMWRVFDNLLNNACKYSLPGTRVYISLVHENNAAIITFKNISKAALNIPSEELMERFVRGDSSRNTEGSGLGLSIAQSLTELMKGTMKLEVDGDLFKVTLRFQAVVSKKNP